MSIKSRLAVLPAGRTTLKEIRSVSRGLLKVPIIIWKETVSLGSGQLVSWTGGTMWYIYFVSNN